MQRQQTIAVVANCQARPLIHLLEANFKVQCLEPIIVHLAKDEYADEYRFKLETADILISQFISDQYPCSTIRTKNLKESLIKKLVLIPNLFYRGYTPDLRYVRLRGQPTLTGPLGDYHSSIIIDAWSNSLSQKEAKKNYLDDSLWKKVYQNVAVESLNELKEREKKLDISVSDIIEREQQYKQLFFTFNHPSKYLLDQLVKRIGSYLNLESKENPSIANISEPLDLLRAPIHSFTKRQLDLQFGCTQSFSGIDNDKTGVERFRQFTLDEIVHKFYQTYAERKDDILSFSNLTLASQAGLSKQSVSRPISNLETALSLFSRLKFKECLHQAQQIIEKEPTHLRAHCLALQASQHLNDPSTVGHLIKTGLKNIKNGRVMFLVPAFEVCAHFRLHKECRTLAKELTQIALQTNDAKFAIYEPRALNISGKPFKAIRVANKRLGTFPGSPIILFEIIQLFKEQKKFNRVYQISQALTTQSPKYWQGHDQLCEELLRREKPKKANRHLLTVVEKIACNSTSNPNTKSLPALHVLQYYAKSKKAQSDLELQHYHTLINKKINLQWSSCLNKTGHYQLLNCSSATGFLENNFGTKVVSAFLQCGPPAMQADVIRVAHLAHYSHALYIDWPYRPFNPKPLLDNQLFRDGRSLLAGKSRQIPENHWSIWNGFGYTTPDDDLRPFFRIVLDQIVENILNRISNDVFWVTGPGVWKTIHDQYKSLTKNTKLIIYPQDLHPVFQPALNKRPSMQEHWSVVQKQESIYTQHTKR
ncbi:hypothetical protein KR100_01195 [Synechococcus sp. KORDI-100]|uniref:WcbI family polysaccharide biosynthesis putative acetyltransferase n=1 Tax=Synechococcus sp. KORDI-100 TaxID=1280380 RepID=UPI0004E02F0F|nr:WcbI family polysaccharide biosynthesis putative acetyltransferase [Synechococcus sp. KORDI-100]AII42022.1 hypothetical protein KR100_01195 [Synechococcus sp. KORDI-100]